MAPKYLISLALFTFSASAHSVFDGVYTAAEFGGVLSYANQTITNTFDLNFPSFNFASNVPYQNYAAMVRPSATGTLLAGYGYSYEHWYIGAELGVSAGYYKMTSSTNTGLTRSVLMSSSRITISSVEAIKTEVNISPVQFGLYLRPGILITPQSLLSMRVGTSFASVSSYGNLAGLKIASDSDIPVFVLPLQIQGKKSRNVAALQLGAGLEQAINEHLKVRMDYLFSYYGKLRFQNNAIGAIDETGTGFLLSGINYQSVSMNTQSILLGLAYHFS